MAAGGLANVYSEVPILAALWRYAMTLTIKDQNITMSHGERRLSFRRQGADQVKRDSRRQKLAATTSEFLS
eukprot:3738923-Amphidinium_carterae.1